MEIITADIETYYDKEYSLTKLNTEAYIRDPRFEVIMLGLRWPDGAYEIVEGSHEEIRYRLDAVDWSQYAVLAHNTAFDAAILSWHFGVKPKAWLDTLSMARAMFGARNNSLASLAKRYNMEDKGTFVVNMMGRRRSDMSPGEFKQYTQYCLHDVELCYDLWSLMSQGWYNLENFDRRDPYPMRELELIDQHIKMFADPVMLLNKPRLEAHLQGVIERKEALLNRTEFSKERLSSNPQFADVLRELGVEPPMKVSKTTGKQAYAFAKTDPELKALLEHPDERVQAAVAARLGTKSTLEETRTQTFIDIATRSPLLPVPLKYSYARTKRSSGGDGINLQNLPAREGTSLKACIEAPPGYVLIDSDSSNIEARVLAWLAGQDDLVEDFANSVDVYSKMASKIYNMPVNKHDNPSERFIGKTVVLGCGYQTGAMKLKATLKVSKPPVVLEDEEAQRIIDVYRDANPRIKALWREGDECIKAMHDNKTRWFGREGIVQIVGRKGVLLPSGLYVSYPQLHQEWDGRFQKWKYKDDTGVVDIYGGKFTENIIQALARIIVMYQLLKISKRYRVSLTVHDSIIAVVKEDEVDEARAFIESCMRWAPKWADGCPINCETKVGRNYGEMK